MKANVLCLLVILTISATSCASQTVADKTITDQPLSIIKSDGPPNDAGRGRDFIGDAKGLIVLGNYTDDSFIEIYNSDGGLWYRFSFKYDDRDGKFDFENDDFAPFAFHPDYHVLAMKCTGESGEYFEVVVSEETSLRKFVKKSDAALRFETWPDHILSLFSVGLKENGNRLHESADGRSKTFAVPEQATLHPIQVSKDWLKVRLEESGKTGWVRWRENGRLLIELFHFA